MTIFEETLNDGPLASFLQDVSVNMKGLIHSRHSGGKMGTTVPFCRPQIL